MSFAMTCMKIGNHWDLPIDVIRHIHAQIPKKLPPPPAYIKKKVDECGGLHQYHGIWGMELVDGIPNMHKWTQRQRSSDTFAGQPYCYEAPQQSPYFWQTNDTMTLDYCDAYTKTPFYTTDGGKPSFTLHMDYLTCPDSDKTYVHMRAIKYTKNQHSPYRTPHNAGRPNLRKFC